MDAVQQDALRPHHLRNYTAAAGVTDEQYVQFVTSDAFADVPTVWLGVALLTRMMTAHSTRRIKQGDVTDIDAMAAYLPYCEVYGADRSLWKKFSLIQSLAATKIDSPGTLTGAMPPSALLSYASSYARRSLPRCGCKSSITRHRVFSRRGSPIDWL